MPSGSTNPTPHGSGACRARLTAEGARAISNALQTGRGPHRKEHTRRYGGRGAARFRAAAASEDIIEKPEAYNPRMSDNANDLTRRGREILEIAQAHGGVITSRQAGISELQALVQLGYINVDTPAGFFQTTSAGDQAVREQ